MSTIRPDPPEDTWAARRKQLREWRKVVWRQALKPGLVLAFLAFIAAAVHHAAFEEVAPEGGRHGAETPVENGQGTTKREGAQAGQPGNEEPSKPKGEGPPTTPPERPSLVRHAVLYFGTIAHTWLIYWVVFTEFYALYHMHKEHEKRAEMVRREQQERTEMVRREQQDRRELVQSLVDTRVALGRGNYLRLILKVVEDAERSISFTAKFVKPPEKEPLVRDIIAEATRKMAPDEHGNRPNFVYRGILAERHKALKIAHHFETEVGVQIRFSDYLNSSNLAFLIADEKVVVLGVSDPDRGTDQAYLIQSFTLASALARKFDEVWQNNGLTFDDYLREVLGNHRGLPADELAERFALPPALIAQHLAALAAPPAVP